MSEHKEQVALVDWVKKVGIKKYPQLDMLFAIPNGGHRHIGQAVKMKKEGVKPGVFDLFISHARGKWHGLYIEMKYRNNKLTCAQIAWKKRAEEEGYMTITCYSADEAISEIEDYFELYGKFGK